MYLSVILIKIISMEYMNLLKCETIHLRLELLCCRKSGYRGSRKNAQPLRTARFDRMRSLLKVLLQRPKAQSGVRDVIDLLSIGQGIKTILELFGVVPLGIFIIIAVGDVYKRQVSRQSNDTGKWNAVPVPRAGIVKPARSG